MTIWRATLLISHFPPIRGRRPIPSCLHQLQIVRSVLFAIEAAHGMSVTSRLS
jgi:hypothetical protein